MSANQEHIQASYKGYAKYEINNVEEYNKILN